MADLLYTTYEQIDAGNLRYAKAILESLLAVDPMNVEAWEACMQISETCEELDSICDQALHFVEFNPAGRESILDYYYFLRQKMKYYNADAEAQKMITFELVDQFTYTLKDRDSMNSGYAVDDINIQQGFAWLLDKAIIILYLVLLAIGLKLIVVGSTFGYWIILVLAISIFVNLWNRFLPVGKTNQASKLYPSETIELQEDVVPGCLKLIP